MFTELRIMLTCTFMTFSICNSLSLMERTRCLLIIKAKVWQYHHISDLFLLTLCLIFKVADLFGIVVACCLVDKLFFEKLLELYLLYALLYGLERHALFEFKFSLNVLLLKRAVVPMLSIELWTLVSHCCIAYT